MKFALVSYGVPPSESGGATMIYRLLRDLSPEDYCLLSQSYSGADGDSPRVPGALRGRYYRLGPDFRITRSMPWWRRRSGDALNLLSGLLLRARQIARVARRERCRAIVGCTGGDVLNLPMAYVASRLLRIPFYAFILDDYANHIPKLRALARRLEPHILKGAAGVITLNEFMQGALRERYGVESVLVRNPCDLTQYATTHAGAHLRHVAPTHRPDGGIEVVFTGAVYDAHYDAFRNLIAAIRRIGRDDLKLHLYTNQAPAELAHHGISGPVVVHGQQPLDAMPRIQQEADILFLPLAFSSPYPEVIRTSAPTKLGEYLAARRPILVHAPADSFLAWYFRRHQCGLVVDESDPVMLAAAIERAMSDPALTRTLAANAWERARADFDIGVSQARFAALMQVEPVAARVTA